MGNEWPLATSENVYQGQTSFKSLRKGLAWPVLVEGLAVGLSSVGCVVKVGGWDLWVGGRLGMFVKGGGPRRVKGR